MKAPFWAVCCSLALGLGEGLCAADEFGSFQNSGPAVAPLARASGTPEYAAQQGVSGGGPNSMPPAQLGVSQPVNGLRYPAASPLPNTVRSDSNAAPPNWSAVPQSSAVSAVNISSQGAVVPGTFATPAGALPVPQRIDAQNAPMTSDPLVGAPSNADGSGAAKTTPPATSSVKVNPWRPIQTAFRQISPATTPPQTPIAGDVVVPSATPGSAPNSIRTAPVRSDGVQPSTSGQEYVEKPFAKNPRMMSEMSSGEMVNDGPPHTGGGCGCGPSGDAAICPNCGGWQPGTCRTNNPEGSCLCQRLACCLCKPYPDCSNGCVDFCHSWIFHEDDCWFTSNHKCCNGNCGPYPYGNCPTDGAGKGNGCGCGNCGPCVPAPDLYFSAEALTLSRNDNIGPQSIAEGLGGSVLGTQDFGFDSDWQTGPRFVLGYSPTPMDAWEFSYFGLQHWTDDKSITGTSIALPDTLGLLPEFSGAGLLQVTYSSEIHDAEVNYSWHHGCKALSWIAGFRYFNLTEDFDMTTNVTGVGQGAYNTRTVNNLYGGQLGARYNVCCHQFTWTCTAKAGAFGNQIDSSQFVAPVGGMIVRNTNVSDSRWAFIGQFDSSVSYYFCKNWCATAGFNAMWIDGVAFAPDQLDFTNVPGVSGTTVNHDGNAMYIGGHVGVGVRF